MQWDKIKVFYYVATNKSFTIAGRRLNISQSAISRSILNLEEQLKVRLFKRIARGIELTPEGEILYKFAQKMFLEAGIVERLLQPDTNEAKGSLKVLTTTSIASVWLMKYLPGFLEKYPEISLNIVTKDEATTMEDADVVIRPYMPDQPDLTQRYLTSFHMRLFASKDYLKKFGIPRTLKDLDNHRLLAYGGEFLHPYWEVNWLLRVGTTVNMARKPYMTITSTHGLMKAAKAGLGIVELGKDYPKLESAELVEILPDLESPKIDIYYSYSIQQKDSIRITALADYLDKRISQENE